MGFVPSGDGIAAALLTLESLEGGDLADRRAMVKLPQTLVNVSDVDKGRTETDEEVAAAVSSAERALGETGRVLLRPSGTEPLVRVMVEAATQEEADAVAANLADVVKSRLSL